ncbi:hypothetical protein C162_33548 [Paenibacillus sp. FSL R7-269]|uniref:hypothetical protein n=1 Tax=Paenibacillus sp. FSL R7-269 TaxID=1226755 RepID=UPI0003E2336A|nr:hypothetical protein [Paenibacillus sp. FSL R7-269]ETT30237.1 hypothetical protein C162_33548 [Paenibacillus sp. FSL R7-269]
MAKLQDYYKNDKSLNIEFVYRDKRPDQGCKFIVTITENRSIVVSEVGWTNFTLNKFVEMLNNFPMDIYNGYFSHYDESFEWKWIEQSDHQQLFLITVFTAGDGFSYTSSIQEIRALGAAILEEINYAPHFDSK